VALWCTVGVVVVSPPDGSKLNYCYNTMPSPKEHVNNGIAKLSHTRTHVPSARDRSKCTSQLPALIVLF